MRAHADWSRISLLQAAPYVVAVAALAAAAMIGYVLTRPPVYEGKATLIANAPKLTDGTGMIGGSGSASVVSASYLPLLQGDVAVREVLQELGLDRPPLSLTSSAFLRDNAHLNAIAGTPLLELRVRLDTPELAARAANMFAAKAIAAAQQLNQQESTQVRDSLKEHLEEARRRLDEASARLLAFKRSAQIEMRRKDVESLLDERKALAPLAVQLGAERAKLARAEKELATRPRVSTITRSIDRDPALMEAARSLSAQQVLELTLRDEVISEVHEHLDEDVAKSRSTIASLEQQLSAIQKGGGADRPAHDKLLRLYDLEQQLASLELETQIVRRAYELAANQHESARLQVASRTAQLQLLSPASPPDRPLPRALFSQAVLAAVLAAAAALTALFCLQWLRDLSSPAARLSPERHHSLNEAEAPR